jgi:hypothetical protein
MVWPRGERALREVQSTAQDFLSLSPDTRLAEPSRDKLPYTNQPCVGTGVQLVEERSTASKTDHLSSANTICFDDEYLNDVFKGLEGFERFQGQGGQGF